MSAVKKLIVEPVIKPAWFAIYDELIGDDQIGAAVISAWTKEELMKELEERGITNELVMIIHGENIPFETRFVF
jgi:hypothetical protein